MTFVQVAPIKGLAKSTQLNRVLMYASWVGTSGFNKPGWAYLHFLYILYNIIYSTYVFISDVYIYYIMLVCIYIHATLPQPPFVTDPSINPTAARWAKSYPDGATLRTKKTGGSKWSRKTYFTERGVFRFSQIGRVFFLTICLFVFFLMGRRSKRSFQQK